MSRFAHRSILLLASSLLVSGCMMTAEQIAKRNEERCVNRGYQPGTDAFADCINRVEGDRDARMEARRREGFEKPAIPPAARF